MLKEDFEAFTQQLLHNLEAESNVVGLVALGSMAQRDYQPDRWSDHDFFVITALNEQEHFRTNLTWLPNYSDIVLQFRETAHGLKVLYKNGHLLEFAVFDSNDLAELYPIKINRYRVLLDKAELEQSFSQAAAEVKKTANANPIDDNKYFGMFLCNLLVGLGRYHRGEKISGHVFVKTYALTNLLILLEKYLPSDQKELLDNLDPLRRFERAYPQLGQKLDAILALEVPQAALQMLRLADAELQSYLQNYPSEAVQVLEQYFS